MCSARPRRRQHTFASHHHQPLTSTQVDLAGPVSPPESYGERPIPADTCAFSIFIQPGHIELSRVRVDISNPQRSRHLYLALTQESPFGRTIRPPIVVSPRKISGCRGPASVGSILRPIPAKIDHLTAPQTVQLTDLEHVFGPSVALLTRGSRVRVPDGPPAHSRCYELPLLRPRCPEPHRAVDERTEAVPSAGMRLHLPAASRANGSTDPQRRSAQPDKGRRWPRHVP